MGTLHLWNLGMNEPGFSPPAFCIIGGHFHAVVHRTPRLIRTGIFLLFSRFAADRFRTVILLYHIANTDFARVKASFWGLFTLVLCHRGTLCDISWFEFFPCYPSRNPLAGIPLLFSRFLAEHFWTAIPLYHIPNSDFARVKAEFWGFFHPFCTCFDAFYGAAYFYFRKFFHGRIGVHFSVNLRSNFSDRRDGFRSWQQFYITDLHLFWLPSQNCCFVKHYIWRYTVTNLLKNAGLTTLFP